MLKGFATTTILAVAASLAVGAWVTASVLTEFDQNGLGQSNSHLIVSKVDDRISGHELQAIVLGVAKQHHVNIAFTAPDLSASDNVWDEFVFEGDPRDHSLSAAPFDPGVTIHVHPWTDLGDRGLGGVYTTTAHGDTLQAVAAELTSAGIRTGTQEVPIEISLLVILFTQGTTLVVVTVVLASALAVGTEALRRRRQQAVRRLTGWSRGETLRREARDMTVFLGAVVAGSAAAAAIGLALYNGFHGVTRVAPLLGLLWGTAFVVFLATHLVASTWPTIAAIPGLLRGTAPNFGRRFFPLVGQMALLTVVVSGLVGAAGSWQAGRQVEASLNSQANFTNAVRLSGGVGTISDNEFDARFGEIVRAQFQAKHAILAAFTDAPNYRYGPDGPDSLIVNRAYLARTHLAGEDGGPFALPHSDESILEVLIPSHLLAERDRIVAAYQGWLKYEADETGATRQTQVHVQTIADGQVTPDFGYDKSTNTRIRTDNVLAVVPDKASALSNQSLSGLAVNGSVLFTDPDTLRTQIEKAGYFGPIVSIDTYGDTIQRELAKIRSELTRLAVASILGVILLGFATWSTVTYHRSRRAAERRVLALNGRSAWVAHLPYFAASSVFGVALAVLVAGMFSLTTAALAAAALCFVVDTGVRAVGLTLSARRDARRVRSSGRLRRRSTPITSGDQP